MQYDLIPSELKSLKRWGVYNIENVDGRDTKVPYQATQYHIKARTNDLSTWSSFDEALEVVEYYDGMALLLGDGLFGVDLDHCEADIEKFEMGEADGIVHEFIDKLRSYAELSPSGKGVHIICKGHLPVGGRRKGDVEMYDKARFFTITGDTLYDAGLRDCTEDIKDLHSKYIGVSQAKAVEAVKRQELSPDLIAEADAIVQSLKSDELFLGNYETLGYKSQSEADLALCNKLAKVCDYDVSMMDYCFRQSGLYREKWDRDDYAGKTLALATENKLPKIYLNSQSRTYDDTGNAERFYDAYRDEVYYVPEYKRWAYYDDKANKWRLDDMIVVKRMFDNVIKKMADEKARDTDALAKHIKSSRASTKKKNALIEAQHLMPASAEDFDSDVNLFNIKNGYINLKKSTFASPDQSKLFMQVAGVSFNAEAKCEKWLKFLDEIFLGDQDLIRFIQKLLGYSLSGDVTEQKLFVLYGMGQNGKSIFIEIIRAIFGDYACNMDIKSLMVRGNNTGTSDIARLKGKRFISTSENNDGARLDEGLVKQLTGGDVITARHLYSSEIEFTPQGTICMVTNHRPIVRGTDDGIWRRLVLIPFKYKIPDGKVNKHLKAELMAELDGIFNWILEGSKLYKAEGLDVPDVCKRETEDYKLEMNPIARFIDERCTVGDINMSVKASDLYLNYTSWASANNEYIMTSTKFGLEVNKTYGKVKKRDGIYYTGIALECRVCE